MKLLIKSMITAFVIASLFTFLPFESECQAISDEVFRLHILANSDSDSDQQLKLLVRDAVVEYCDTLFCDADSKAQAQQIARDNLASITDVAQKTVYENGSDCKVTAEICRIYFTTREYSEITMPSGMYDALRIKIGRGEGHNWWCVMYPSLCLYSSSADTSLDSELSDSQYKIVSSDNRYEFRFRVVELYERLRSLFS